MQMYLFLCKVTKSPLGEWTRKGKHDNQYFLLCFKCLFILLDPLCMCACVCVCVAHFHHAFIVRMAVHLSLFALSCLFNSPSRWKRSPLWSIFMLCCNWEPDLALPCWSRPNCACVKSLMTTAVLRLVLLFTSWVNGKGAARWICWWSWWMDVGWLSPRSAFSVWRTICCGVSQFKKINMGQAPWMDIAVWQSNSLYHVEKQGSVKTINLTSEAMRHQTSLTPQPIKKNKTRLEYEQRRSDFHFNIIECALKPLNILLLFWIWQ